MRVTEVPLAAASLNGGDVFVADLGARLFVWSGAASNPDEKVKALEVVEARRAARGYQAEARPARPPRPVGCKHLCVITAHGGNQARSGLLLSDI